MPLMTSSMSAMYVAGSFDETEGKNDLILLLVASIFNFFFNKLMIRVNTV